MADKPRYKVERVAAFTVAGASYSTVDQAKTAIRRLIITDILTEEMSFGGIVEAHEPADVVAEHWDRIEQLVKEALRGL